MRNNLQSVNFTGTQNCMYVSTVSDLRLLRPGVNGQVVFTSGQIYVGDGQGNAYSWSETATGTDDGISIIASTYTGQTGRWLILSEQGNIDAVVASLNTEVQNRIAADAVLQNNINAETQRAETSENNISNAKVNRTGDAMYGRLNILNNEGLAAISSYSHTSGNTETSNGLIISVNNGAGVFNTQMKQNDSGYYGSLATLTREVTIGSSNTSTEIATKSDITDVVAYGTQSATGSVTGGYYTKVGNILTQGFIATGNGVSTISFPMAYTSGTIPVVNMAINLEPNSTVYRSINFANTGSGNTPTVTNTSFEFYPFFVNAGNQAGVSGRDWTLHVIVMGTV